LDRLELVRRQERGELEYDRALLRGAGEEYLLITETRAGATKSYLIGAGGMLVKTWPGDGHAELGHELLLATLTEEGLAAARPIFLSR
jgi:hypothetical protein